ncbi:MAG: hypothetical protein R2855_05630 [Thermomicrobiales bacterium]
MNTVGPLQLVVINFDSAVLPTLAHAQVDHLRRRSLIGLIDSVVTVKGKDGELIVLDTLDAPRGDPRWSGLLSKALFGLPNQGSWKARSFPEPNSSIERQSDFSVTEEQLLEIADLIPVNSRALILLIEHLWAAELDIAAAEAHGHVLANCWITPTLLSQMLLREQPLLK